MIIGLDFMIMSIDFEHLLVITEEEFKLEIVKLE